MSNKSLVFLLSILIVSAIFLFFFFHEMNKTIEIIETPLPVFLEPDIRLLFVGDIMLTRGVAHKAQQDYLFPFRLIRDDLRADFLFGNLESVISDQGRDLGGKYSFRADPRMMEGLVWAGFDVVSVANNHSFDYGRSAFDDSLKRLADNGILYSGGGFNESEAYSPAIVDIRGIKVAVLSFSDFWAPSWLASEEESGITMIEEDKIKKAIESVTADLVVVSFHYGDEYQKQPNQRQREISQLALDWGADLVVGHHPHVTQPVEGRIAYSLGNFIFDQYFSEETMQGFILEVIVRQGQIKEINQIPYKINPSYQPYVFF